MADNTKVGDLMNNPALWSMVGGLGAALSPKDTWSRDLGAFTSGVFGNAAFRKNMLESQGEKVGDLKSLLDYGFASPEQQLAEYKTSEGFLDKELGREKARIGEYGAQQRQTHSYEKALKDIGRVEEGARFKDVPLPKALSGMFGKDITNLGQLAERGLDPKEMLGFAAQMDAASKAGKAAKVSAISSLLNIRSELNTNVGMGFVKPEDAKVTLDLIDQLLPAFSKDADVIIPKELFGGGDEKVYEEGDITGGGDDDKTVAAPKIPQTTLDRLMYPSLLDLKRTRVRDYDTGSMMP